MKRFVAAAVLLSGSMALGQQTDDASGFHYWSHSDLANMTSGLASQMDAQKFKSKTIATEGNHRFLVTHREAAGQSEYHEKESDIVFVQNGHATLIYGGKMVGAKTTAPGELRGTGIEGGSKKELGPGDVVVIPTKMPHQFEPQGGEAFNYFVVKVTDENAAK